MILAICDIEDRYEMQEAFVNDMRLATEEKGKPSQQIDYNNLKVGDSVDIEAKQES